MSPPNHILDYISHLDELLARGEALVGIRIKTIAQITQEYEDTLDRFVRDVLQRGGGEVDFRRSHKALIRSIAEPAYVEGMREAGGSEDDLDDDDRSAIETWTDEQVGYVDAFAADIRAASLSDAPEGASASILARVPVWVASLRNLGDLGRLSALGNVPLTLDGPDGKESCVECQTYKGQRHTKKWWERRGLLARNGNPNYTCGRWEGHCQHYFRNDDREIIVA